MQNRERKRRPRCNASRRAPDAPRLLAEARVLAVVTTRIFSRLAAVGMTLALVAPGVADAHGRKHHNGFRGDARACAALKAGYHPKRLSEEQLAQIKTACDTYLAAVKSANETFKADTKSAADAYKAVVAQARTDFKAARDAKRSACEADRKAQACTDARAAFRQTVRDVNAKVRAAHRAYREAVRPAAKTRHDAVKSAKAAFRAEVKRILGS
jgi:hypothetical protein